MICNKCGLSSSQWSFVAGSFPYQQISSQIFVYCIFLDLLGRWQGGDIRKEKDKQTASRRVNSLEILDMNKWTICTMGDLDLHCYCLREKRASTMHFSYNKTKNKKNSVLLLGCVLL